jgi:hypothetical protein
VAEEVALKRLAWGLLALFVVLGLVSIGIVASVEGEDDEALTVVLIGYATVGAMIASRDRRNLVGWLLLVIALSYAVQGFGEAYVSLNEAPGRGPAALIAQSLWYVWLTATGVALPLVFPTGRLLTPRWRPVVWLLAIGLVLSVVGSGLKPGEIDVSTRPDNPLGVSGVWVDVADVVLRIGSVLLAMAFGLAAASLILRIRRSRGTERAQLKWFALVGVLATGVLAIAMLEVLFPGGWRDYAGGFGWNAFLLLAIFGIPAATGIAILRHGLYDIDVVIRRTLVYGGLTATLAAGYLGCVLLAQLVIGAESSFAIAISTLAMAALFRPALAWIQALVDRRFYRRRYDARQTLEQFGSRLREELDLEALGADLRGVVRDTMQPASVSLWLRSRE